MNLIFLSYAVETDGVSLLFAVISADIKEYTIFFTDAELAAITTQLQLRNAVITKLQRKVQAAGIASKLDTFIGQQVTI